MENRLETSLPRYQPAITITRIYSPRVPCQGAKTRRHTRHPPSLSLLKAVSSRFARTLISCACYTHTFSLYKGSRHKKKESERPRRRPAPLFRLAKGCRAFVITRFSSRHAVERTMRETDSRSCGARARAREKKAGNNGGREGAEFSRAMNRASWHFSLVLAV